MPERPVPGRDAAGGAATNRAADAPAAARRLWASRFHAVLSTQSRSEPGYPFGSLVPYCLDPGGRALLLLSHLAQHRHNLDADPRCALTLVAAAEVSDDIQQTPRLTVLAEAAADPDPGQLERWCRCYPSGRRYAGELNFALYRLEPRRAHYNGGFATARWFGPERLLHAEPLIADTERALLERVNVEQADRLAAAAAGAAGEPGTPLPTQAAGIDPDGLDLRRDGRLMRLTAPWPLREWPDLQRLLEAAGAG